MGKVRIKTLGADGSEDEQKKRDEKRRASKRARKESIKIKTPGKSKGGERVVAVGPSEAEIENAEKELKKKESTATATTRPVKEKKSKTKLKRVKKTRSKRYKELQTQVDRTKFYNLQDAIKLVQKTSKTTFTGSIEAHINMRKKAKELSLKTPKKSKDGKDPKQPQIAFEKKQPVAHATLGKTDAKEAELVMAYEAVIKYIGINNIRKITLASTMGPGVKVKI